MKNTLYISLLLIIFFVSFCTCQKSASVSSILQNAEDLMKNYPDSSLYLLETIQSPEKLSSEEYATWCLLVTQARDKNYVEHTSDSLINIAVRYFEKQNDKNKYAKSLYYKGRIFQELNESEKAVTYFVRALDVAQEENDFQFLFLVSSRLGSIYAYRNIQEQAFDSYQQAYEFAVMSGDSSSISYAHSYLGRAYSLSKKWAQAKDSYIKALKIGECINDLSAQRLALNELASICIRAQWLNEAQQNIDRILVLDSVNMNEKEKTYLIIGNLYRTHGEFGTAEHYLLRALSSDNIYTKRNAYQYLYYMHEEQSKYKEAMIYNNHYQACVDSILGMENLKVVLEIEKKYENEKILKEKKQLELQNEKMIRGGLSVLIVLIGLVTGGIIYYQYQLLNKRKEIDKIRSVLMDLEYQSKIYENTIQVNNRKIAELSTITQQTQKSKVEIEEKREQLIDENSKLMTKIEYLKQQIQKLCLDNKTLSDYKEFQEQKKLCPNIFVRLKKEGSCLCEQEREELIVMMDLEFNQFTERLSQNHPDLTKEDILLCCLIKLRYSLMKISSLLSIQEESVLKRIQRIKHRIDKEKKWKKGELEQYVESF